MVWDIVNPVSYPFDKVISSAASTDRVTRLHYLEDQIKIERFPLLSTINIMYSSWDDRSLLWPKEASSWIWTSVVLEFTFLYFSSYISFLNLLNTSYSRLKSFSLASEYLIWDSWFTFKLKSGRVHILMYAARPR